MNKWFRDHWKIFLILLFIIFIRFGFTFLPAHSDLRIQAEWGKWMYLNNGPRGLYDWNVWSCIWPNHPPLISWIYFVSYKIHSFLMLIMSDLGNFIALNRLAPTKFIWFFNFIKWFGEARYETSDYLIGVIIVIKQIMVISDIFIAGVIYFICKSRNINWKKYVLIYLLLPFSWYLSSIWGQSDQISFLFLIISFILLIKRRSIWSPIFLAIAINLKPDCIVLVPLYIFIWFKQKQPIRNFLLGGLLALTFSLWTVSWFNLNNLGDLIMNVLIKRFNTSENLVTLNAFNFWYIFYPSPSTIAYETTKYLFLNAKTWGWIIWLGISLLTLKVIKYKKIESIFLSIFIVGFGSWLFLTGMHERYAFFGMVALLFYSIYKKRYLKDFVILSTIYFLSMFYVYSIPVKLDIIKLIFNWKYQIIPRLLSIVNICIYVKVIKQTLTK